MFLIHVLVWGIFAFEFAFCENQNDEVISEMLLKSDRVLEKSKQDEQRYQEQLREEKRKAKEKRPSSKEIAVLKEQEKVKNKELISGFEDIWAKEAEYVEKGRVLYRKIKGKRTGKLVDKILACAQSMIEFKYKTPESRLYGFYLLDEISNGNKSDTDLEDILARCELNKENVKSHLKEVLPNLNNRERLKVQPIFDQSALNTLLDKLAHNKAVHDLAYSYYKEGMRCTVHAGKTSASIMFYKGTTALGLRLGGGVCKSQLGAVYSVNYGYPVIGNVLPVDETGVGVQLFKKQTLRFRAKNQLSLGMNLAPDRFLRERGLFDYMLLGFCKNNIYYKKIEDKYSHIQLSEEAHVINDSNWKIGIGAFTFTKDSAADIGGFPVVSLPSHIKNEWFSLYGRLNLDFDNFD